MSEHARRLRFELKKTKISDSLPDLYFFFRLYLVLSFSTLILNIGVRTIRFTALSRIGCRVFLAIFIIPSVSFLLCRVAHKYTH